MQKTSNTLHPDLLAAQNLIYEPMGLTCTNIQKEAESEEYGAFVFDLNTRHIKFRVAKITPTKIGQFVTLWKRSKNGPIVPHDIQDSFDFFVISVRDNQEHFGHFVFPKHILCAKDIISKNNIGGKLGIRVYPPWDITESSQAKKTQAWQLLYFFEIKKDQALDPVIIKKLYGLI